MITLAAALLGSTAAHATVEWDFVPTGAWTVPADSYARYGVKDLVLYGQMIVDAQLGQQFAWGQVQYFNFGINGSDYWLGDQIDDEEGCGCEYAAIPDYDFRVADNKLIGDWSILTDEIEIDMASDEQGNWYGGLVGGGGDACNETQWPCYFSGYWVDPPSGDHPKHGVPEPGTLTLAFGGVGLLWWKRKWGLRV